MRPLCAAGAGALAGFGAQQPAAQIGGPGAVQLRVKGAVGGFKQVVAFVKNIAARQNIIRPRACRLVHDQRVVGNHNVGAFCLADAFFNEAFVEMRAGGVNAFAAAVGKIVNPVPTHDADQPAGEIFSRQIAIRRHRRPACHQAQGRRIDAIAGDAAGLRRVFKV